MCARSLSVLSARIRPRGPLLSPPVPPPQVTPRPRRCGPGCRRPRAAWAEDEQASGAAARPGTKPPRHRLHQHLAVPQPGLLPLRFFLPGEEESHLGREENLLPLRHLRPALHLLALDHRTQRKWGAKKKPKKHTRSFSSPPLQPDPHGSLSQSLSPRFFKLQPGSVPAPGPCFGCPGSLTPSRGGFCAVL